MKDIKKITNQENKVCSNGKYCKTPDPPGQATWVGQKGNGPKSTLTPFFMCKECKAHYDKKNAKRDKKNAKRDKKNAKRDNKMPSKGKYCYWVALVSFGSEEEKHEAQRKLNTPRKRGAAMSEYIETEL
jgi:hypothetical protein